MTAKYLDKNQTTTDKADKKTRQNVECYWQFASLFEYLKPKDLVKTQVDDNFVSWKFVILVHVLRPVDFFEIVPNANEIKIKLSEKFGKSENKTRQNGERYRQFADDFCQFTEYLKKKNREDR